MKKLLLSLFCLILMAATAGAETYTHTFKSGELTTDGGTVTLSDIEWTASSATYIGWNNNGRGIQLGSKNTLNPTYQLSTSALAGCTIRSITVNSCIASNGDAKLTISVGSQTSEAYTLTTSDAAYTFDCEDTTGDISINWTATDRAYYVKSITIEYTPDAGSVTVPAPEFKTPVVVYADKVQVTAETTDQSAVLYYTLDGTDPSYEDYVNDTGSTKCSKYWVMYFNLTQTTTIKVIAVKVDGDAVFKSAVAEQTYIVSRTMPYVPANSVTSGNKYAIVAADSAATYFYGEKAYGYLPTKTATAANDKYIETVECAGFTFTAAEGGYTIQDELGRYVYHTGTYTSFNYAAEKPAEGAVWSVTVDADSNAAITCDGYTIHYSTEHKTYGCYPADKVTEGHVLPKLYMQREYPTYTVSPAAGSTFDRLETITVTCEEGIAATDDLKIEAEGIKTAFTVKQTDKNTLTITAAEPLTTYNNRELNINITAGDIMLNPSGMNMGLPVPTKYGVRTLVKYVLTGNAPAATIDEVSPANGATVEELSHFVFTFSYYAVHSDDASLQPRLYAEGKDWTYALEQTLENSEGAMIGMQQAALKTTEPLKGNGTYILEIPTGYFTDANGRAIEGITLKYTVKNDSGEIAGIEDIIANDGNSHAVFTISGVKVLETTDAEKTSTLPAGIYVIDGKKVYIK
ncbi:MAG: chitobiase/beta-hexosaminidase C-terminal domain-containing protein [Bacteroidaceae bacterium]|nr:chitobiase/beta-hexosaminidase C-terminal domain-containing protein [Bacteroidaceae bacterium]MBR4066826.1 chitobiase/beta-hexosaminidase C-terminal domain-containing protein [Bacteroidaceae bacterium]